MKQQEEARENILKNVEVTKQVQKPWKQEEKERKSFRDTKKSHWKEDDLTTTVVRMIKKETMVMHAVVKKCVMVFGLKA